ncbi:MAG: hypothetical protein CW342_00275 [Thermoactinomycetaceae bacterium]|nr:hypothetical protein [Thermoactinomycetaceae bacterium]
MLVWEWTDRLDALIIPLTALTDPSTRWAVFGGVLLFLILWLSLFRKLPPSLYLAAALCALIFLRALFPEGWLPLLWVFLLTQAAVSLRFSRECTFLLAALLFLVYQGMPWMDEVLAGSFHPGMLYENFPETIEVGFYFVLNACLIRSLRKVRQENAQLKRENRQLIERVNEAHRSLHEYIVQLEEMSRRDYLTGLYNFSGFQEQLTRSLARCAPDQSYHVICIDLVDFQQINLQEGTDAGDQLLVTIARRLKRSLPSYAQVARYEGDQFAVGLIGDDSDLRHALEAIESVFSELREERSFIHFCWATASYPREAQSAAELLRLAEHRLSIEQRRIRHEEEERQRHLEKLSAIGQLAAGLAHEIRNPLTSIRGFIQISMMESEEMKKWESIILPEIDRINDLLKQFLDLSDTRPSQFVRFELDGLIADVLRLLEPKAILDGHQLTAEPPPSPVVVEGDPEKLKQVLINLIKNGLESLGEKGQVWIRWRKLRDRIHIRVQDNGCGIQPEHMSRIFDPFFTTKGDGTGMGLSICHRIISDHGGQIHVTSQPGRGTIFNIHLPIQQFHAYPVAIPPVAGKDEGTRRQGGCAEGEPPARSGEDKEKPVAEEILLALRPPSL